MNQVMIAVAFVGFMASSVVVAQQAEIATSVAFTEGPVADRDGNVYFTELVPAHHEVERRRASCPSFASTATMPTVC